jgi:hypothetical protein
MKIYIYICQHKQQVTTRNADNQQQQQEAMRGCEKICAAKTNPLNKVVLLYLRPFVVVVFC